MLKSSSSSSSRSRVVWEDFQGALRTHAVPHGNLKTGETPSTNDLVVESIAGKNQKGFWTTRSITCASLTFNNLAFVLVLAIEVMCRGQVKTKRVANIRVPRNLVGNMFLVIESK